MYIFGIMVVVGFIVGLVYDIYRVFRWILKPPKLLVAVLDLLFWILTSLLCFYVLFETNYSEIRFYMFVGFGIGWVFYLLLASRYIIALLNGLLRAFEGMIKGLWRLFTMPFKFIFDAFIYWRSRDGHKNF